MPQVETIKGPVDTAELGTTLMHEHIFVLNTELQLNYDLGFDRAAQVAGAIERLNELKAKGVDTIVDLTVVGLGRDLGLVSEVAAGTELHIVVATGLYTYNELPFWFHNRGPGTLLGGDEPMVEMFATDIEQGVHGSGAKAAILKCATDEQGVTPDIERVLRACAQVHRRTGVPITTHTHARTERGLEQQAIFEQEGVDLTRVIIGHSGDTDDLDYLERVMAEGSYLGMDRFGVDAYLSFEARVGVVAELCRRGHADQLVLSHDTSCHIDWYPEAIYDFQPRWRYTHITDDVVPALLEAGTTQDQIDQMLITNPRAIFERQGGY